MAISDVATFAHLSEADVEALGREFDAIRQDIEESRGAADAAYIGRIISAQRRLMVAARLTLFASGFPPAWVAGTTMLAAGKILENMEIGHNVMHGQWDWMNDPEIHSGTWEWDTTCPAEQWKHSHNFVHHTFTNVLGKDNDVGYGILRVSSDQKWHPVNLGQPVYNALLALLFEWGVALHDLDIEAIRKRQKDPNELKRQLKGVWRKVRRQVAKDYIIFHAVGQRDGQSGPQSVVLHDHLLRALPGWCGKVHRRRARGRDQIRVVPPPVARVGQLRGKPVPARHGRQPGLSD
jgi:fatty acid desaturase